MPKPLDKPQPVKKVDPFHWDIKPEPAATTRDRIMLAISVTALVCCVALLAWLAYR